MVTIWSLSSRKQLKEIFDYINADSPQNAEKVRDEIIAFSIKLCLKPEIYPLDKFKIDNDGSYRAFEIHRYRISYRVLPSEIRIVRLRHTSRSPLPF